MSKPVRIRIADATAWWDLRESLARSECSAERLQDGTVEVRHDRASSEREAHIELTFFVRAWQLRHPNVAIEFLG